MPLNSQIITGMPLASAPASSTSDSVCVVEQPLTSSFFNGGVRVLKVRGTQVANSNRSQCSRHGAAALGARMSLLDRFARVVKVLSSQKRLENKYKAAQQASEDWYRKAQFALEKGDEDLAREALKRRKSYADNASALKAQFDQQKNVVENLVSNTQQAVVVPYCSEYCDDGSGDNAGGKMIGGDGDGSGDNGGEKMIGGTVMVEMVMAHGGGVLLESKIQEAKSKKDTLKARAQSAKTASKVNEMLGNVNTSNALAALKRWKKKKMLLALDSNHQDLDHPPMAIVLHAILKSKRYSDLLTMESQAEALGQLTSDELDGKFALLESSSVDDDLANLKKELSGSSKKGELPPGRASVSSTSMALPFQDTEVERELNELRQKAKDS
ncbi:Membrane-associated 30 kDa protein, chloroplastic [Vitis vinifera]|uniref:Membrane-associated 30 kDa protein, chloroplastic n=1 Tax=Vitis vinifera TaxID=29760 RepID=A0A438DFV2_VITVI|nr:Membrane-associated 30 kDa protein, chloroplastic [Vitis vinifera]